MSAEQKAFKIGDKVEIFCAAPGCGWMKGRYAGFDADNAQFPHVIQLEDGDRVNVSKQGGMRHDEEV